MSSLLHLSDPHFGTERPEIVSALLELEHTLVPEIVVVSGDITQRARRAQFEHAVSFLRELQAPNRLYLPGNHDIPLFNLVGRILHPYRGYRRHIEHQLEPVWVDEHWTIVGVNTTRAWRHVNGEVSGVQRRQVTRQLRDSDNQSVRLVVTHQPVQVNREKDLEDRLIGAAEALPAWVSAGADLFLGGHIHYPFVEPVQVAPSIRHDAWVVQAGTSVSSRVRDGISNSVNLLHPLITEQTCSCHVERWDYQDQSGEFELADSTFCRLKLRATDTTG